MRPTRKLGDIGAAALVVAIGSWAAIERFSYASRLPTPVGVDGSWYVRQLTSVLETGLPAEPMLPLVPYLGALLALGLGPVVGVKLLGCLAVIGQALGAHALVWRRTGVAIAGVPAAAVVATSPGSAYMSVEFVQQGCGMAALLWCWATLARPRRSVSPHELAAVLATAALCCLTHKLAGVLALIGLIAWWDSDARSLVRRRTSAALSFAVLGIVIAVVLVRGEPRGLLSARLDWTTAPIVFAPGIYWSYGWEVAMGALAALAVLVLGRRERIAIPELLVCGLAVFLVLPWIDNHDVEGAGMRLRIAAFVALGPCVGLLVARLREPRARVVTASILSLGVCTLRSPTPFEGVVWPRPSTAPRVSVR